VMVVNAAVSDQEGVARFQEAGTMSKIVAADGAGDAATAHVRTLRLDDFTYGESHPLPDFLKLDIEGHAGAALGGMTRILAERHPRILCELHDPHEEHLVTTILTAHGYNFEPLDQDYTFPRRIIATADAR